MIDNIYFNIPNFTDEIDKKRLFKFKQLVQKNAKSICHRHFVCCYSAPCCDDTLRRSINENDVPPIFSMYDIGFPWPSGEHFGKIPLLREQERLLPCSASCCMSVFCVVKIPCSYLVRGRILLFRRGCMQMGYYNKHINLICMLKKQTNKHITN